MERLRGRIELIQNVITAMVVFVIHETTTIKTLATMLVLLLQPAILDTILIEPTVHMLRQ